MLSFPSSWDVSSYLIKLRKKFNPTYRNSFRILILQVYKIYYRHMQYISHDATLFFFLNWFCPIYKLVLLSEISFCSLQILLIKLFCCLMWKRRQFGIHHFSLELFRHCSYKVIMNLYADDVLCSSRS